MYRLISIFSITLSLIASSVASAQEGEDDFMGFPEVKVKPIDFQQVFAGSSAEDATLVKPTHTPVPELATPIGQIDSGFILDESNNSQLTPGMVQNEETVAASPAACPQACLQCEQSEPCECKTTGRIWGCVGDYWRHTCIYRNHIENLGDPCLFCERPLGVCQESWFGAMIAMGRADRAVLHDYDFADNVDGVVALTARGKRDLQRIARIMDEFCVPLTIESTDHPTQDAARHLAVVNAIAELGLPISPNSIRMSPDQTIGLSGEDAQAIETIRINEMATGASRTRPYSDSSRATIIPVLTGDSSRRPPGR